MMKSRIKKKRLRARENDLTKHIVTATATAVVEALSQTTAAKTTEEGIQRRDVVRMLISALDLIEVDPQFVYTGENPTPAAAGLPVNRTLAVLYRKLLELLTLLDVRPMPRDVTQVNYSLHEPVRVHITRDGPESEGRIVTVMRTGYLEGSHVLRPTLVEVLKYVPGTEEQPKEKEESTYGKDKKEEGIVSAERPCCD